MHVVGQASREKIFEAKKQLLKPLAMLAVKKQQD